MTDIKNVSSIKCMSPKHINYFLALAYKINGPKLMFYICWRFIKGNVISTL